MSDLDYSQQRSFNVGIAVETGSVGAAMIYDDLVYAQKVFGTGFFYRSHEQMEKRFPMFSERTIRRHIDRLEQHGWLATKIKKVEGTPLCHYQIVRFLSAKMSTSKDSDKMSISINKETKETTKPDSFSFGADIGSELGPASTARARALLPQLIEIVNPKEKMTAERLRVLNGRLGDYTEEEILQSATAFSKSEWHKKNKQMSIDNLIAPSKFGKWYAQRVDIPMAKQANNMVVDPFLEGSKYFPAAWPKGEAEFTESDDESDHYFRGVLLTPQNTEELQAIDMRREEAQRAKREKREQSGL